MLITLENIKTYLGISGNTYDGQLELYIELVQGEVEAYLDKKLEFTTYSGEQLSYEQSRHDLQNKQGLAYRDYSEPETVFLQNYPVVQASGFTLLNNGQEISSENYQLKSEQGYIELFTYISDFKGNFTANYSAGYTVASLPAALKAVLYEGVRFMFETIGGTTTAGQGRVQSKEVRNFSVQYFDKYNTKVNVSGSQATNLKFYIAQNQVILDRYRRVGI